MHACDRSTLLDGRDERGAAAVAQAFAGAAVCERKHEAADGNVCELRQDNVGTGTDLLGRLLVAQLLNERGDQPLYAQAMRGLVGSDVVEPRIDEVADTLLDLVPDLANRSSGSPAGSSTSLSPSCEGTRGQLALQWSVIAQSACSCISRSSFFGRRRLMSIPTSRIASTTFGQITSAGSSPADSARMSV